MAKINTDAPLMTEEQKDAEVVVRVAKVEADVVHLTHSINDIASKIDKLASSLTFETRTNWATLGTWAAVLLVLVGMWTKPMIDSISELKMISDNNRENLVDSIADRGRILDQLSLLTDKYNHIDDIDVTIGVISEKIKGLEKHVDEEVHPDSVILKISELKSELAFMQANRFTSEQGARISTKVDLLETELYKVREEQRQRNQNIYLKEIKE